MLRLRDFPWWPNEWIDQKGRSVSSTEIGGGVLKNARCAGNRIILIVEHDGGICTGETGSHASDDFIVLLRHILLQHWGETLSAVEDLEVDFGKLM